MIQQSHILEQHTTPFRMIEYSIIKSHGLYLKKIWRMARNCCKRYNYSMTCFRCFVYYFTQLYHFPPWFYFLNRYDRVNDPVLQESSLEVSPPYVQSALWTFYSFSALKILNCEDRFINQQTFHTFPHPCEPW